MTAHPHDPPLIRLERVTLRFGPVEALAGVSLDVAPNETVVVLGPPGAGKSTLLRCMNGLEPGDEGRVVVDGVVIGQDLKATRAVRRETGAVLEAYRLYNHLTVLDNVTLSPRVVRRLPRARAEARALELLERVGLATRATRHPEELTPGQQQQVMIARALAMEPKILLLDDPTAMLERSMADEVLDVIANLAGTGGLTIVVATDRLDVARRIADRVVIMDAGRIVEVGPPGEVFTNPTHDTTRRLLAEAPPDPTS